MPFLPCLARLASSSNQCPCLAPFHLGGCPVLRRRPSLPAAEGMLRSGLLLPVRSSERTADADARDGPRTESVPVQPLVLLVLRVGHRAGPAVRLFPVEETPPAVRLGFAGAPLAVRRGLGGLVLRPAPVQPVQLVPYTCTAALHGGEVIGLLSGKK